jgi:hypothetical protein
MSNQNLKQLMYLILMISLVSGVTANTINLNSAPVENVYSPLVEEINNYVAIKSISKHYETISISIDNYSIILDFEDNKLKEIRENHNEITDLHLSLSKEDAIYLLDNWQNMSYFERFKYVFKACDSISDALILGSITVSLRGEI